MKSTRHLFRLCLGSLLCGCGVLLAACTAPATAPVGEVASHRALSEVESWGYQLQNIDLEELAGSDYDLLVIDAANDESRPFTQAEIERLRTSGKTVLSYLSIGEAETYRPYWNPGWVAGDACDAPLTESAPAWLEGPNPDWCGNYLVRYWDTRWQRIVIDSLRAIAVAGFDGVYLDKVDSFYTWTGEEDLGAPFASPQAAVDMVAFIEAIAEAARSERPNFVIVQQNAAELIEYLDEDQRAGYLRLLDGIAVEDTFFYPAQGEAENAPYAPQAYVIDLLAEYQSAGLPVFAVDYVTEPEKVDQFMEEARADGFIPYAGVRALDRLVEAP